MFLCTTYPTLLPSLPSPPTPSLTSNLLLSLLSTRGQSPAYSSSLNTPTTLMSSTTSDSMFTPKFANGSSTLAMGSFPRRLVKELVKQGAMKPSVWGNSAARSSLMTFSLFSPSSVYTSMVAEVGIARNIS